MTTDFLAAPLEIKSMGDPAAGTFSGYGAIYGNIDRIGDRLLPGCFAESLAEAKASGRRLPMHLNHGLAELNGERGVGVYSVVEERDHGLYVEGKISGMNTDRGRLLFERVRDGAIGGLSIGFKAKSATYGRNPGEPRRTIKSAALAEISLVDDPCNASARVLQVKAALGAELDEIKARLAAGDLPSEREFERALRDAMGFTRAQAEAIAELGFKSLKARESGGGEAKSAADPAALRELRAALDGFSLPTL